MHQQSCYGWRLCSKSDGHGDTLTLTGGMHTIHTTSLSAKFDWRPYLCVTERRIKPATVSAALSEHYSGAMHRFRQSRTSQVEPPLRELHTWTLIGPVLALRSPRWSRKRWLTCSEDLQPPVCPVERLPRHCWWSAWRDSWSTLPGWECVSWRGERDL